MYEGEGKKKKMYYSSYLVMVAVRNLKKKNADGISFSTAVQIFIQTVLKKKTTFFFLPP